MAKEATDYDWGLVRKILIARRGVKHPNVATSLEVEGYERDVVREHLLMLIDQGFLEGRIDRTLTSSVPRFTGTSPAGEDLLLDMGETP